MVEDECITTDAQITEYKNRINAISQEIQKHK